MHSPPQKHSSPQEDTRLTDRTLCSALHDSARCTGTEAHLAASFAGLLAGLRPAEGGRTREPLVVGLTPESQLPPPRPGVRCRRGAASCGGCPAAPMSHRLNSRSTCTAGAVSSVASSFKLDCV